MKRRKEIPMSEHDVSLAALLFLVFSMACCGSYLTASSLIERKKRKTERVLRLLTGLAAFWLVTSALEALRSII